MSYRLVESEAGNFSLFRSKESVLRNRLQGRAWNKAADRPKVEDSVWSGQVVDSGLWFR